MKTLFATAALALFFVVSANAQTTCQRHIEAAGRFSYCPPSGWVARDPKSGPYKSFFAPESATFNTNLNVKSEATTLSNDEYTAVALRIILKDNGRPGVEIRKVVGWTEFTTDSNIKGSRMVYELTYQGVLIRTLQYILDLPGSKLLLTGTALMTDKDTTDKLFDAVAKSVKLIP